MPRYSETVIDHVQSPRNHGRLDSPDAVGLAGARRRGRFVEFHLRIEDGRVAKAVFQSDGCGPTIASASVLSEMITGKSVEQCRAITVDQLLDVLGGPLGQLNSWQVQVARGEWQAGSRC